MKWRGGVALYCCEFVCISTYITAMAMGKSGGNKGHC